MKCIIYSYHPNINPINPDQYKPLGLPVERSPYHKKTQSSSEFLRHHSSKNKLVAYQRPLQQIQGN